MIVLDEKVRDFMINWDLFKGKNTDISKKGYVGFCEVLYKNNHKLLSEYINATTKVLIDFNCGHQSHWIKPNSYKNGNRCPKCGGSCPEQAKEDLINLINENGHKLLSEYINATTKVLINFGCGHESHWITPHAYKSGQRCPKCSGHCPKQAKEDFLKLLESNSHVLLSEYKNATTKVLVDFNCGHDAHWIAPNHYKKGHGCPKCVRLCSEQAKKDLIDLISKNGHKLINEYINSETKVLIDFGCGHEPNWITPSNYKIRQRCPKCSGKCSEQAKENLVEMINNNGHKLLSEYINNSTKVLINFNCGHEPHWITPHGYKSGQRCPKCSGNCSEQAKKEFLNMLEENEHKLLSEYINNSTKVLVDFNCGHDAHWIAPGNYKSGKGCPLCKNKGEGALISLIEETGIEVEVQKKYGDLKDKLSLAYDFYLPEYNLLIELDGGHHYKPVPYYLKDMTQQERDMEELDALARFEDRKRKDRMKDDYAKVNNIPLLRIDYSKGILELDKWKQLILNKIKEIEVKREFYINHK